MNIQEWAEFYFSNKINVIPDSEHFDRVDWRHKNQTIEELRGYGWASTKEIYAIIGKKGIRAINLLKLGNESVDYKNLIVDRTLSLLGIPQDYPWVVDYVDSISIIIETPDDIQGMDNRYYRYSELLWQDTLLLPSGGDVHFYFGQLPKKRPTHIDNKNLLDGIEILNKDINGESDWPYFCGQIMPNNLPVLDNFRYLSLASKYDNICQILIGCWYMRDKGLHKINVKESGELIERTGKEWRFVNTTEWSYGEESTKNGTKKHYLHIKGVGCFNIFYVDEHILYAKNQNEDKMFLVKEDAVDSFKNNDDIVSYFSQIENRGKLQMENNRNLSENKTGCLAMFSVVVLILTILLV